MSPPTRSSRTHRWLLLGLISAALGLLVWLWPRAPAIAPLPPPGSEPTPVPTKPFDNPRSGLRTFEIGRAPAVILLHGYGSDPEAWFPFVETLVVPGNGRLVFPGGPETTQPPDGPEDARAWWKLELYTYRTDAGVDMSQARPAGLRRAAGLVRTLVGEVEARLGAPPGRTVLGGFSQGAMVAAETAFTTDVPLRGLVLLGGTVVNEAGWRAGMASRRGLRVFLAHGRADTILPFAGAERMRALLTDAGLTVVWVPFEGGHEIAAEVVAKLNQFLSTLP